MIKSLFSTPVYIAEEEYNITEDIREFLLNLDYLPPNEGGNLTSKECYLLDTPKLAGLKKYIENELLKFCKEHLKLKDKLYITQSWSNVTKVGKKHHRHYHPNSFISGAFYIQGDKCPIVFIRPNSALFGKSLELEYEVDNEFNTTGWWIENANGKVCMFPSNVDHFVQTNTSATTRISIAFNTFVKQKIGSRLNMTEVILTPDNN